MIICGVKLTHDGGVAVIDGSTLRFSIEVEKTANTRRYSPLADLDDIGALLEAQGCDPADVDVFVVDGWFAAPGEDVCRIRTARSGRPVDVCTAPYDEDAAGGDCLRRYRFDGLGAGPAERGYVSYHHASGHLLAAYCTSPFAARRQDALVLVWDGRMLARLYRIRGGDLGIESLGPLLPFYGNLFGDFCAQFTPFLVDLSEPFDDEQLRSLLSVPGKAMAFAALGNVEPGAFDAFDTLLAGLQPVSPRSAAALGQTIARRRDELFPGLSNADLIASLQAHIGNLLVDRLRARLPALLPAGEEANLCLSGGCALNIKWNSQLRASGLFREVWVPPFPNDSGAAIGAACCEMVRGSGIGELRWDVYRGPELGPARPPAGWSLRPCDESHVAKLLHTEDEPVVVLSGRAELGPRALGNRSVIAPATSAGMKDRLNDMKGRERYRPVAPICLEPRAAEVFDPGVPDPYMLFEHTVRREWTGRVPAVMHLDGTARLQTVSFQSNPVLAGVLEEYERMSGIPVLCNTSANFSGRGFFPDVASAAEWGRTRYIWSGGYLYTSPLA